MTAPRPDLPAASPARAPWWCAVIICAAAFAAYHNSLEGPFVFDDASSITTNPTIRHLWPLTEPLSPPKTNVTAQGRPVLNLSLAINYAIGGTDVRGYHLFNLVIHALAGLSLFGIVRRTWVQAGNTAGRELRDDSTHATWMAFAVAALWTVHPLQTESVTYIIQRAESLMGLFYLLTLYCFVRSLEAGREHWARRGSIADKGLRGLSDPALPPSFSSHARLWQIAAVVVCAAGMATKEVMATAPIVVWLYDGTFVAGGYVEALRRRRRFYTALASTWLLLAWLIAQTGGNRGGSVGFGVGVAWWDYWLTQVPAVWHYLWLSIWPATLVFEYGSYWIYQLIEIVFPGFLLFLLLGATVLGLRRRTVVGFIGACFFGILAPTSLAPGTTQMIVEHRMYLPLAAVLTLIAVGVDRFLSGRTKRLAPWLFGAVAITATFLTIRRNEDYRTEVALWRDTIAKRPDNPLAHFMLAGAWERQGNAPEAVASYEAALWLKPDFSLGHENYGELLLKLSRRSEAIAHFEAALRLQPEFADAHMNLGNALLAEGRLPDALSHLATAVRLMPDSSEARYNYGNALAAAGRAEAAVAQFEGALKLKPGVAETHFNLGNVLMTLRRTSDAIQHYEAALQTRSDFPAAHYNLANALAMSGRQAVAVAHYEAALRAQPDYAEAHHNLGSALFELGRLDEARRHYEEALRLSPNFPNARENLARVKARMESESAKR